MPSAARSLCVFGDSHFACTKMALDAGLVDAHRTEIEFWGNVGKQFRHLTWRNDRIEPLDDFTSGRFAKTNAKGRTTLSGDGLDMILFMGCRIDIYRLFPEALHRRRRPEVALSTGVERRWLGDFLRRQPPYQFARNLAAQGTARIVMAPVSFDTAGFDATIPAAFEAAKEATPQDRKAVWDQLRDLMAEDAIDLLAQPDETVVNGCCTDPAYAVQKYNEREDPTHKNPTYGALILNKALEMLGEA